MAYNGPLTEGQKILIFKINGEPLHSGRATVTAKCSTTHAVIEIENTQFSNWNIDRSSSRANWGSDNEDGYIELEQDTTTPVAFDTVIISESKIEEIKAAISQIEHKKKLFDTWGFSAVFEKGFAVSLLFYGIPGTGKTLMAAAVAHNLGYKLKILSTADIETSEPGGAERNIRNAFREAKGKKMILLFDECDSLLTDRNEVGVILAAQVNALLTEIEQFDGVIIFTTNRLGKLDPAMERRITAKIEFEFPNAEARLRIWRRMIPKKAPLGTDVDFDALAQFPMTGGNIKNAVLNAARSALYKNQEKINQKNFIDAIEKEVSASQAFIAEYEAQTHQSPLGKRLSRGVGAVKVSSEHDLNKK